MTDGPTIPGWVLFDPAALEDEDDRKTFLNRKSAVEQRLLEGKRPFEVFGTTNIRATELNKLIGKCEQTHPEDQRAYGYRGLVPDQKTKYERKNPETQGAPEGRGKSGLFEQLLNTHEVNLKEYIKGLYVRGKKLENGAYRRMTGTELFEAFLERCRLLLHYPANSTPEVVAPYPFSTPSCGERSFYRFLEAVRQQHLPRFIALEHGQAAAVAFATDSVGGIIREVLRLLESVQLDGHRIDAEGVVRVPQPSGMPSLILLSDVMSVDWIDRAEDIVFGHHLALTGSYNRYDVLRAIASGLGLIRPIEGITEYLPVHFLPQLEWATFDRIELDRALAHLAEEVVEVLHGTINAQVLYDEAYKPKKRAHIESLYAELESRGIRRLPSAHRPGNSRISRAEAFKRAKDHQIDWAELEETIKDHLRKRLLKPNRRVEGRSKLDLLRWQLEKTPSCIRHVPPELRFRACILRVKVSATVRGSVKGGKRPRCNVIWGDYRGKTKISVSDAYIGHELVLIGDAEDVRFLDAYEGERFIERMKAERPWAATAHSFETRSNAMKLFRLLRIHASQLWDGVATYRELLLDRAKKSPTKQIGKELARLEREQRALEVSGSPAEELGEQWADEPLQAGEHESTSDSSPAPAPEKQPDAATEGKSRVQPPWRRRRGMSFI